ncbi:D-alanyl-D-alanine carboxypeptidase family protein [Enterococcus sp. BWT-B8]|uniref:D-alanyl-D-alanine carboxypeptidase family protein n=1 Tax=Enterococcus sp. BWT-B8 TaxID=2885157 RepID=UPI001E46E6EC|nr:D-alanyl-D-alanine carboxypeptidase family protein [Enterococcus sp. BWT-B8]MCB5953357.1 D-alanyl-D-alanine carboxypeptidase family protein [Enterococcus sp. BWT-B8]
MRNKLTIDFPILVNSENQLQPDFLPADLVQAPFSQGNKWMETTAAAQLEKLIRFIGGEKDIIVTSAYRSFAEQEKLYNYSLCVHGKAYTELYVARPGCSEHQTGLAVDLGLSDSQNDEICPTFNGKEISTRFLERMSEFGFILRYPEGKSRITGIAYEPWHFRYVGCSYSRFIAQHDWTLEEYYNFFKQWREKDD